MINVVGSKRKPPKGEQAITVYSELTIAGSPPPSFLLAETQRWAEEWESYIIKKKKWKASIVPSWEAIGMRNRRQAE